MLNWYVGEARRKLRRVIRQMIGWINVILHSNFRISVMGLLRPNTLLPTFWHDIAESDETVKVELAALAVKAFIRLSTKENKRGGGGGKENKYILYTCVCAWGLLFFVFWNCCEQNTQEIIDIYWSFSNLFTVKRDHLVGKPWENCDIRIDHQPTVNAVAKVLRGTADGF